MGREREGERREGVGVRGFPYAESLPRSLHLLELGLIEVESVILVSR